MGWYTGRISENTRRLLREDGGFLYLSDFYNDDLPYWLPGAAATGHPVHAGQQRRALLDDQRLRVRRGLSSGCSGRL
ncbi:MAG: hypothetical protein R2838_09730 [Caldilineaceae bacterium]